MVSNKTRGKRKYEKCIGLQLAAALSSNTTVTPSDNNWHVSTAPHIHSEKEYCVLLVRSCAVDLTGKNVKYLQDMEKWQPLVTESPVCTWITVMEQWLQKPQRRIRITCHKLLGRPEVSEIEKDVFISWLAINEWQITSTQLTYSNSKSHMTVSPQHCTITCTKYYTAPGTALCHQLHQVLYGSRHSTAPSSAPSTTQRPTQHCAIVCTKYHTDPDTALRYHLRQVQHQVLYKSRHSTTPSSAPSTIQHPTQHHAIICTKYYTAPDTALRLHLLQAPVMALCCHLHQVLYSSRHTTTLSPAPSTIQLSAQHCAIVCAKSTQHNDGVLCLDLYGTWCRWWRSAVLWAV